MVMSGEASRMPAWLVGRTMTRLSPTASSVLKTSGMKSPLATTEPLPGQPG
jgi:hypothetical protein